MDLSRCGWHVIDSLYKYWYLAPRPLHTLPHPFCKPKYVHKQNMCRNSKNDLRQHVLSRSLRQGALYEPFMFTIPHHTSSNQYITASLLSPNLKYNFQNFEATESWYLSPPYYSHNITTRTTPLTRPIPLLHHDMSRHPPEATLSHHLLPLLRWRASMFGTRILDPYVSYDRFGALMTAVFGRLAGV